MVRQLLSRLSPPHQLIVSFAGIILVGAALLMLPAATTKGSIHPVDALFTSTSAVCVTGLTVLDTGKDFSLFGQLVILGLIQCGGIGIITFSLFFMAMFGKALPYFGRRQRRIPSSQKGADSILLRLLYIYGLNRVTGAIPRCPFYSFILSADRLLLCNLSFNIRLLQRRFCNISK